jgi:LysR family transcriptional regulator, hypochlorite-specific transcription factor HypT
MDIKLLEDLIALAQERSVVRAAEKRNVTHPAFGRRIRALESWAGVQLIDRARNPLQLTEAGTTLLARAQEVVQGLRDTRVLMRRQLTQAGQVLRLGTGRTLARTVAADWLVQLSKPRGVLQGGKVEVRTGSVSDVVAMLERDEVDLICCYEHPAIAVKLSPQRFRHLVMARDKLVPVSRANVQGEAIHDVSTGPLIAYAHTLSLGALLAKQGIMQAPDSQARTRCVCDSADAIQEYVIKGLGVAWLPWSMVASDCKRGTLVMLGKRSDEVHFEVRLYRKSNKLSPELEAVWAATER